MNLRTQRAAQALMVLSLMALGASGGDFEMPRWTIDSGGTINSAGGDFELSGTIGQPDAGVMEGGGFALTGGFWFELPPGDCEEDGDVDLLDYHGFEACLAGPDQNIPSSCGCYDVNRSGTVDLLDFAVLQTSF